MLTLPNEGGGFFDALIPMQWTENEVGDDRIRDREVTYTSVAAYA